MQVAIIGGTGFVGGYLVDELLEAGHTPSLLVRPGSENKVKRRDDCRIVAGTVASDDAVERTLEGCDAAIFNIGILREGRGATFEGLQYEAAVRTIDAAKRLGVRRFLLMSANGVKSPGTPYQATKFRAEEHLKASGLDYTIFRPSVIFGDPRGTMEFATQLYRQMVRPPLPASSFHSGWSPATGEVVMSPVHVEDIAKAFVVALGDTATIGKTFTLGGPEVLTWTEMLRRIAAAAGKRKLVLPVPIGFMRIGATLFDWLPFFPVTRDQLTMLEEGNDADPGELEALIGAEARGFVKDNLAYLTR